ncbi:MAG TPA: lamin tail domain-containing protein, partial [Phnomibacter sp.]|nr:lamin tail domain-containing protein [Phnomibacter sp.]
MRPSHQQKLVACFCLIVCTIVCSENILAQARYSVVISEIMADPTPQVALPNAEWLELKNPSTSAINLQGFRLQKPGSSPSGPMPAFVLQPDSSVIVCTASQVPALSVFGNAISVTSFPSLGNDGDQLILLSPNGSTMHAVAYDISWYKNDLKAQGGWSLEMIDSQQPCSGAANWTASVDAKGGTPGKTNSVQRNNPDASGPRLLYAFANTANSVTLTFDEPLDSSKAAAAANYTISDGIGISTARPQAPFFNTVSLLLNNSLAAGKIYTVTANALTDCSGNGINQAFASTRLGLNANADSLDVVVNEILFNARPQEEDYVELYNRSNKVLNLRQLTLANRSSSNGQLGSFVSLSPDDRPLFPGDFMAFTVNADILKRSYTVFKPMQVIQLPSLPSFPDDKGWAVVLNQQGKIVDELAYSEKWHFALLNNDEGVALDPRKGARRGIAGAACPTRWLCDQRGCRLGRRRPSRSARE